MTRNKLAALLLVISAIIFISLVLFIEKISDTALTIGSFTLIAAGTLFIYLYAHRFSKTKRWVLLFLIIAPSLVMLLRSFFRV